MTDERDYLAEARALLAGNSSYIAELNHLSALDDHYQVQLIKLANSLEQVKREMLHG